MQINSKSSAIQRFESISQKRRDAALKRFYSRIQYDPFGGCWLWSGACTMGGYGEFSLPAKKGKGTKFYAHRVSVYLATGRLPDSKELVCHTCDIPACVNPAHLVVADNAYNRRDCVKKGRNVQLRGERHPHAKLKTEDVLFIRSNRELGSKALATKFGVGQLAIRHIWSRKFWAHVP